MCACVRACVRACVCVCVGVGVVGVAWELGLHIIPYVNCFGRTVPYMCIGYFIYVNMYHVSAQSVDERVMKVHFYYYHSFLIRCLY